MAIKVEFIGVTKSIEAAGKKVAGVLMDVSKVAGGVALGVAFTKAIPAIGSLTKTSQQLELQMRKSSIVFGDQIGVVQQWASANAAAMGLSRNQATSLAAGLADLLIPMGFTRESAAAMATDTMRLAGALSEWSGGQRSAAEVAGILQAAFLGETDSLQGLGIALSAADIAARLAWKGQDELTGAALKQAEAIAIQELILERSVDAQKAYAEGANTSARKTAEQAAKVQELKEKFAVGLTPVIQQVQAIVLPLLTAALTKLGATFDRHQPTIVAFTEKVRQNLPAMTAAAVGALATFLGMVNTTVRGVTSGFTTVLSIVSATMTGILTVVDSVGRAIYTALQWINPFAPHSPPLTDQVRDGVALIKREFSSLTEVNARLEAVSVGVRWFEEAMAGTARTIEAGDLEGKLDAIRRTGGSEAVAGFRAATAAVESMRDEYKRLGDELASNTKKLERDAEALDREKKKLEELNDAVDDAKKKFDEFRNTPILEEKQYDEALKKLDTEMTNIELKINRAKQKGPLEFVDADGKKHLTAAGQEVEALEAELEKLRLKAEEVELEKKLKVDPLIDQLDALDDAAPKPFASIYAGAKAAQAELEALEKQQADQVKVVEEGQAAYDANAASVEAQRQAYEDLGAEIERQNELITKYVDLAKQAVQQEEARAKAAEVAAKAEAAKSKAMGDGAPPSPPAEGLDIGAQLAETGEKVKLSWAEAKQAFAEVKTELAEIKNQLAPIGKFFKDLENVKAVVQGLALGFGIYAGVVIGLKAAILAVDVATKAVTIAQWAWNAAMNANPIGLIVIAIAAVAAAVVLLIANWDTLVAKFPILGEAQEKVQSGLEKFTGFVTGPVIGTLQKLGDKFSWVFDGVKFIVETFVRWYEIQFKTMFEVVMGIITFFHGLFTGDTEKMKQGVMRIVNGLKAGIKEAFELIVEIIKAIGPNLLEAGGKLGEALKDGFINGVKGTVGVIGNLGEGLLDALKSLINTAIKAVNRAIPNDLSISVMGKNIGIDLPDDPIPELAKGGVVRARPGGRLALIGEGGQDEAVLPLDRLRDMLRETQREAAAANAGPAAQAITNHFNIHSNAQNAEQLARELAPLITRVQHQNRRRAFA